MGLPGSAVLSSAHSSTLRLAFFAIPRIQPSMQQHCAPVNFQRFTPKHPAAPRTCKAAECFLQLSRPRARFFHCRTQHHPPVVWVAPRHQRLASVALNQARHLACRVGRGRCEGGAASKIYSSKCSCALPSTSPGTPPAGWSIIVRILYEEVCERNRQVNARARRPQPSREPRLRVGQATGKCAGGV